MHRRRKKQLGATMVSVMLLTVSLLTVGVLVMRQSHQEVAEAGALVARERATMAAQAALDLAASQYRNKLRTEPNIDQFLTDSLTGYLPQANQAVCDDPFRDCVPGSEPSLPFTGQKNHHFTNKTDCAGRPCMRQGAIVRLPNVNQNDTDWVQVPLADLLANGDGEARVSVWIRNNTAEVLGENGTGDWSVDADRRIVLTAMATLRNTSVAIEQELIIAPGTNATPWQMQTPDLAYGGGHNNDNASVDVCRDSFAEALP